MTDWYLLIDWIPANGATNMARDTHLLDLMESGDLDRPVLRLYFWDPPTLSLGFHQAWQRACLPAKLDELGIRLVRRPTGGRAVLHHDEITYCIVAPMKSPFSKTITHNYQLIAQALHRFTNIGPSTSQIIANAEKERPEQRSHPCFASLSTSEIASGHKKLVGSAQKLGKIAFLQHGSIPLKNHREMLRIITGTQIDLEATMTCLEDSWRPQGINLPPVTSLIDHLVNAFSTTFQVAMRPLSDTGFPDENQVQYLEKERFLNPDWTFRR